MSELLPKAVEMLSRREHSRFELKTKLKRSSADNNLIEEVLDFLEEKKLQSDKRFAEEFVRWRVEQWGNQRLKNELKKRGVDDDYIQLALAAIADEDENDRAFEVLVKRQPLVIGNDEKIKARCMRFLITRGFSHTSIKYALNKHTQQID